MKPPAKAPSPERRPRAQAVDVSAHATLHTLVSRHCQAAVIGKKKMTNSMTLGMYLFWFYSLLISVTLTYSASPVA